MRIMELLIIMATVVSAFARVDFFSEYTNGDRQYKLMYQAEAWLDAKAMCESLGQHLAVPDTVEEFLFIQSIVRSMHYPSVTGSKYKLLAWLGISNLQDYRVWRNVHGDNIRDAEFHKWSESNGVGYSDNLAEPHCAGLDAFNYGLRSFWCNHRQPYVCEKQLN